MLLTLELCAHHLGGGICASSRNIGATSGSAAGLKVSGVGRQQLLKQPTPGLRLGLSVRLRPGRPNVPELQGLELQLQGRKVVYLFS